MAVKEIFEEATLGFFVRGEKPVFPNKASFVIYVLMLFLIFITGGLFEKEVFGAFAFAPEFFWEDFGSAIAMVVHISYFILFFLGLDETILIRTALLAYLSYLINAAQFVIRLLLEKHNEKKLKQRQAT